MVPPTEMSLQGGSSVLQVRMTCLQVTEALGYATGDSRIRNPKYFSSSHDTVAIGTVMPSRHFISLRSKYSSQHPVLKHPQSTFPP
jgi:hypothetical protein